MSDEAVFEAEGETVGEAKWLGLRELERRFPGLDRAQVTFEVLSEGERGLLGVGTTPARVLARVDPGAAPPAEPLPPEPAEQTSGSEGEIAVVVRTVLEEIARSLDADCR